MLGSNYFHKEKSDQFGINMVDLMMWMVIAALLLAAAIQGIGYYQKATYLYHMKSDASSAGTNSMTKASDTGDIDKAAVDAAVLDTKWTSEVTYAVEESTTANRKPYIRISHPAVTDRDVIYLFDSCGEEYAIGANVVPKDSNPVLESCGVSSSPDGGDSGDGGGSGTPVFARSMICANETYGVTAAQVAGTDNAGGAWNSFSLNEEAMYANTYPGTSLTFYNAAGQVHNTSDYPSYAMAVETGGLVYCFLERRENGILSSTTGPASKTLINGNAYTEEWRVNNILHREGDQPAKTQWGYGSWNKSVLEWYIDGKLHRIGNPAKLRYDVNEKLIEEAWYTDGKLHRANDPARTSYFADGGLDEELWYTNGVMTREKEYFTSDVPWFDKWFNATGQLHRVDGPAHVAWEGTQMTKEEWRINGAFHRVGAPANIVVRADGTKQEEHWYVNGVRHREGGPAQTSWDSTGKKVVEYWYTNGTLTNTQYY